MTDPQRWVGPVVAASLWLLVAPGCGTSATDAPTSVPDAPAPTDTAARTDAPQATKDTSDEATQAQDATVTDALTIAGDLALIGGQVVGQGPRTVVFQAGQIVAVAPPQTPVAAKVVDVTGRWLAPSFIDSHVHALYRPATAELARGGLGAVIDHAAPLAIFTTDFSVPLAGVNPLPQLRVLAAGPMVTPLQGYPTQSWGSNGYGIECADLPAATAAIDSLKTQGARFIKVPVGAGPDFPPATLTGIVDYAHQVGLKVSTHATSAASALQAATAGCDVLAHTPTQTLPEATINAWAKRHVVSTLSAFGGSAATVSNLQRLKAAGTTVLYGTDYGNTTRVGIDPAELGLLLKAGLSGDDIVAAATSAPAAFWGLSDLGAIAAGFRANLLVLDADPTVDPMTLSRPVTVYLDAHALTAH